MAIARWVKIGRTGSSSLVVEMPRADPLHPMSAMS